MGDGLLERARSTSLALLGASAAVGLGLTAFAVNQGWPLLPGAPIPDLPTERGAVHDAVIAARAPAARGVAAPPNAAHGRGPGPTHAPQGPSGGSGGVAPGGSPESRVGGAAEVVPASTPAKGGGGGDSGQPPGGGAADVQFIAPRPATAPPPAPSPAPESPPEPEAPPPHPGNGNGNGNAYAYGHDGAPPSPPHGQGEGKGRGSPGE